MGQVIALTKALGIHFGGWHPSRLICLAQLVLAILTVKTINLVQVSSAFKGKAKHASNYKRINRFMAGFTIPLETVAMFVVSVFSFGTYWYIAIDRTNWKFGKKDINVFVLSICHGGIAVPLLFKTLNKKANTKTADRIEMLNRFINLFGVNKIASLLGDREFIGKKWIKYLLDSQIPFTVRIKQNFNIPNSQGKLKPAKNFFRNLASGEVRFLGQRKVLDSLVYVVGTKEANGDLRIVITDSKPEEALCRYSRRHEIETLFGCLKTRGFNFESTHMTDPKRIDNLLAVMTIAFAWSYRAGEIFKEIEPIKIKSHGDRAKSIFRHGYDYLRRLIFNIADRTEEFFANLSIIKSGRTANNSLISIMRA